MMCNESIEVMGKEILHKIIYEIQHTKYFSLILDSNPDASRTDKLSVVIRYCFEEHAYKRFLIFISIHSYVGKVLLNYVTKYLADQRFDMTQ